MNWKSKSSKKVFVLLICLGAALMIAGVIAGNFIEDEALGGRLLGTGVGFGSGIISVGVVFYVSSRRNPKQAREQEINEKDERFIKIREKSAMGTWYITLFSLLALEFAFSFLDYVIPLFAVIGVMAVHVIGYFVLLYRNSKRM